MKTEDGIADRRRRQGGVVQGQRGQHPRDRAGRAHLSRIRAVSCRERRSRQESPHPNSAQALTQACAASCASLPLPPLRTCRDRAKPRGALRGARAVRPGAARGTSRRDVLELCGARCACQSHRAVAAGTARCRARARRPGDRPGLAAARGDPRHAQGGKDLRAPRARASARTLAAHVARCRRRRRAGGRSSGTAAAYALARPRTARPCGRGGAVAG